MVNDLGFFQAIKILLYLLMIITFLSVFFRSHLVNPVKEWLSFLFQKNEDEGQISVFLLLLIPKCLTSGHKMHYVERLSH